MPELPEVETVRRALAERITGLRIARAEVHRPDLRWPLPEDLGHHLAGRSVRELARRGKYLLIRLSGEETLLVHFGMTGRILLGDSSSEPRRHEHFTLEFADGTRLHFVDPRRFGSLDLLPTSEEALHPRLVVLGPEPFDPAFTEALFARALADRYTPIKAALLDQHTLAGLGNIYASEALFRARISPRRLASHIGGHRAGRLLQAIRATLTDAIAAGGSSFSDYVHPNGELGNFQRTWKVYGCTRCPVCPGPPRCHGIGRIVQAGRTSFYCPLLQR